MKLTFTDSEEGKGSEGKAEKKKIRRKKGTGSFLLTYKRAMNIIGSGLDFWEIIKE